MTNNVTNHEWEKLTWEQKIQICQQGESQEDGLLHTYVTIFIALEAMFFAIIFTLSLPIWLLISIAILAVLVSIWFIYIFYKRGQAVDRWGELLWELWKEAGKQEFIEHYKGCYDRRKRGWFSVVFGWDCNPWNRMKSARRVAGTYTPLIIIIGWILATLVKIINYGKP